MTIEPPRKTINSRSVYLGRYDNPEFPAAKSPLGYARERHLLTFGPTGCGKGTGLLVPNLLSLRDRSVIVMDPKGELTAITADFRRTVSEVVVINPFDVLGIPSVGFNPLASLDPDSDTFYDDAKGIAEAMIKIEEKDSHWTQSAQSLVSAFTMWEVRLAKRESRTSSLENVRRMMTERTVYDRPGGKKPVGGFRYNIARMCAEGGFEMESSAARFLRDSDEIGSIQSTADAQTDWLLSRPMRRNLAHHGIDFKDLKKKPITVYIILPAERMRTHSVWLRLLVVTALRALYTAGGLRTLFILDEFAQLGHLGPVEDALGLVRGYGVQLWPILQDLTQLKALYRERWETFIANAGVVQGFTPNDLTTAEWMSKRAGDTTAVAASFNLGNSDSEKKHSANSGIGHQQTKRRLFLPSELMGMRRGAGLFFLDGYSNPVPFFAPSYWNIPSLNARAKPNPYYTG